MQLIQLDPTYRGNDSAGKYGKWLLNLYNKGNLSEDDFEEVTPLLNQFTTYRNRIQNKDINSYKSLDALSDVLASVINDDSMLTDRQKVRFLKNIKSGKITTGKENDYDVVFNNANWIVCVPNTHEASMKLGKGTSWCTAHENPEWYNAYTYEDGNNYSLFIMKNKHTGEKFQYCDNPYRGNDYQFMDESDTEVDEGEFMSDCISSDFKFAEWLHELNPDFFKMRTIVDGLIIEDDTVVGVEDYFEPDIVIPDEVKYIGEDVFRESDSIRSLYISSSVTQIGSCAFAYSTLEKVDFDDADNLFVIGAGAFAYSNLDYVSLSQNLKIINNRAFMESTLIRVYIDNVSHIGEEAFMGCDDLVYVGIDDSDGLRIKSYAFANCTNLEKITLPDNIIEIASDAFYNCSDDLTIYTDSQWIRDNIESFNVNLCDYYGDEIYIKDKGFVG